MNKANMGKFEAIALILTIIILNLYILIKFNLIIQKQLKIFILYESNILIKKSKKPPFIW